MKILKSLLLVALISIGGGSSNLYADTPVYDGDPLENRIPTAVWFGASIINNGSPTGTPALDFSPDSPIAWLQAKLNHRLRIVNYSGVGGQGILSGAARFQADALSYQPDYVFIGGDLAANFVGNPNYGSGADVGIYMQQMVDAAIDAGVRPIIATMPPNATVDTDAAAIEWHEGNRAVIEIAKDNPGVILWRWDKPYTNYTQTYPNAPAVDGYTVDGTHLEVAGAVAYAEELFPTLDKILPELDVIDAHWVNPGTTSTDYEGHYIFNPAMTGDVGGYASGWTKAGGTATGSKVARTDHGVNHEWQQIDIAAATADVSLTSTSISLANIDLAVGDTIWAIGEMQRVDSVTPVNCKGISMEILYTGGGAGSQIAMNTGGSFVDWCEDIPGDETLTFETPEDEIPSGVTAIRIRWTFKKGSGGNITVRALLGDHMIIKEE